MIHGVTYGMNGDKGKNVMIFQAYPIEIIEKTNHIENCFTFRLILIQMNVYNTTW